ncbi:MAG: hypothetical protein KC609_03235, partial [Myxococcales bacterium]|nr:hypothetical protein [Myxococcales bacterium]
MFGSKIVVALATMGLLLVTTPAIAAESGSGLGWSVTFLSRSYDSATDRTTFSYRVSSGSDGSKVKALSHFVVGLPSCESKLEVLATAPSEAVEIGTDPTTGVYGVKWDLSLEPGQSRDYSLTIAGNHAVSEAKVAVKAGKPTATISLSGISCASGDDDTPGDDTPGD